MYESLLFVGLLLFVAHHIEKNIWWQRNVNCHVDVNSRVVWGLNVVRLLIRMVIDQSHDSNSAGGSSGTKGGGCTYNCAKRNELI